MQASSLFVFSTHGLENVRDDEMIREDLRLAEMAEDLGFDIVWAVEHHFTDYAMCTDNFVALSYLAARTSTIKLGTGAVILPWNDPLRVAEKACLLDAISNKRLVLGVGRGLARVEYEGFGVPMDTSRERFDEAAAIITEALETGVFRGDGRFYAHEPIELRPRPTRTFKDRTYAVGSSPASMEAAADLGAGLLCFVQTPIEKLAPGIEAYRKRYRDKHHAEPPPPMLAQELFCHDDPAFAGEMAQLHIGNWFMANVQHYELFGTHWTNTKGYEFYAQGAEAGRNSGMEAARKSFVEAQLWGTPDQILQKMENTRSVVGDFDSICIPAYGGLPYKDAEVSYQLYAKEVLPELRKL